MSKNIVVTTSASSLNYYENPHHVYVIFGQVTINGRTFNKTVTDVQNLCPMLLRDQLQTHPQAHVIYTPPTAEVIYKRLCKLQERGYEQFFVVLTNDDSCRQNFLDAIARFPAAQQARIFLYHSTTLGFGTGLLALKADQLLRKGSKWSEITRELKQIEKNSILLYTILGRKNLPDNPLTQRMTQPLLPFVDAKKYPLMRSASNKRAKKIAAYDTINELFNGTLKEIRKYIGTCPYNGYIVCPVNQEAGEWFADELAQQLGRDHISNLPVTPVVANLFGVDLLAVRVYRSPNCFKLDATDDCCNQNGTT